MQRPLSTVRSVFLVALMVMAVVLPMATPGPADLAALPSEDAVAGRAQTTWSGTVLLSSTTTVAVNDELVISACTTVQLGSGVRLVVDGRLTVQGTTTCPVIFEAAGSLDHEGIQFNASSLGRGSRIDNLTLLDATYGITMFGGDARFHNLTIDSPDRVGIDLFGATPVFEDLTVVDAGQNAIQTDWRFGLGLSVGAGSAPVVKRADFSGITTRGLNVWGGSGGVFQDITMDNITGSSLAYVAGVWVEDSVPLLQRMSIDRADNGLVVRHVDDTLRTRAVVKDMDISNSMYRGVLVDKENRTNYTNYESADITGLTVTGTGGPGAKTPGIAEAAVEINATGAWLEDVLIDGCSTVGLRMYFTDASSTIRNLTVVDAGDAGAGAGAHASGVAVRSGYFAPTFDGLSVSGSPGSGVHASGGGSMQGSTWNLSNNSEYGLRVDYSEVIVDGLLLDGNGFSGLFVEDGRSVELSNLTASNNGQTGVLAGQQAGLHYLRSNDIESNSGDVRCQHCEVRGNAGSGLVIEDSVDLWIEDLLVEDVAPGMIPIAIDNSNLNIGQRGGRFRLMDITVWANATDGNGDALPAVDVQAADGAIEGLGLHGVHAGVEWNADIPGQRVSYLHDATLDDAGCLALSDQKLLRIDRLDISGCAEALTLRASNVNITDTDLTVLAATGASIDLTDGSTLHLSNTPLDASTAVNVDATSMVEEAWPVEVWVRNLVGNGVPFASVDLAFTAVAPARTLATDVNGHMVLQDAIARVIDTNGASAYGDLNVTCTYAGVSTSVEVLFDDATTVYCDLPLSNQAPFVNWTSPEDETVFPSNGEVTFDASTSWDMDNDPLTFRWTSTIDGDLFASCTGSGLPGERTPQEGAPFTVNSENDPYGCTLSDGVHQISVQVCDPSHCVTRSRTIELVNLAPVLSLDFEPSLNPWSELVMPQTGTVIVNTTGTSDPEGDVIFCGLEFDGYTGPSPSLDVTTPCATELVWTFNHVLDDTPPTFQMLVIAMDELGNNVSYPVPVTLYNEVPEASFTVERESNASSSMVTLDASAVADPEGNVLTYSWASSVDGVLAEGEGPVFSTWSGWLSRGVHTLTMTVNDDRPEHVDSARSTSMLVTVVDSIPRAILASPADGDVVESADLLDFSAEGSGDWDASCSTFPTNRSWWCVPGDPAGGSQYLNVVWTSDLDGRLTPEGVDWLLFEARLSAGNHTITLSVDDGLHDPVESTVELEVLPSAPVLEVTAPQPGHAQSSSQPLVLDARSSFDADGDAFTMSVSVDDEFILSGVDASRLHQVWLPSGEHDLNFLLEDDTGAVRTGIVTVTLDPSPPTAIVLSPDDLTSFAPGAEVMLVDGSVDRDGDLVDREWRLWSGGSFEVVSSNANHSLWLPPGTHHLSVYVQDARGSWSEDHVNITVQSSVPRFVAESLQVSPGEVVLGERTTLRIVAELEDADGTTEDVQATVTLGDQLWTLNLTHGLVEGVWEGSIEVVFDDLGDPYVRVVATDGVGDAAQIDVIATTIEVVEAGGDGRAVVFGLAGGAMVVGLLALNAFLSRRRRISDVDLIASWGVLQQDNVTAEPEATDIDSVVEEEGEATEQPVGGGFDWDDV